MDVKEALKQAIRSRAILGLWALTLLQALILVVVVFFYAHSNELQVPVRYSAFSDAKFYHNRWYYLLSFAAFALVVYGINAFVSLKLLLVKSKSIAIGFLLLTSAVLFISTIILVALLRVTGLLQ